jgi:hypothetical protein
LVNIENKFITLWEFFAWMDKARWMEDDEECDKRMREMVNRARVGIKGNDLEPADMILAHWLTYIFDYGMRAERIVWNNAFPIMAHIAYHYRKGDPCKQIIREHVKSVKSKSDVRKKNFEFHAKHSSFMHRFGRKHRLDKCVERTLSGLEAYSRNLVIFMLEKSKDSPDDKWVRETYYALYELTYKNGEEINYWHKRTWSALRDYLKGSYHRNYVCKALEKHGKRYPDYVLKRWKDPEPYLDQLELPGDIWNNEFFERIELYVRIITRKEYKGKSPQAIRDVYNRLRDEAVKRKLYPEQFDVTFDFAQLCRDKSCQICPLSPTATNTNKLCIGELHDAKKKYCPLLSTICQYFTLCNPKDCPVFKNITHGLCPCPE